MLEFLKQLPDYYRKSAFVRSLVQANETEFQRLYQRLWEYERERYLETAENLEPWEESVQLGTPSADTLELRRKRIYARMRGCQTTTRAALRLLAETYLAVPVQLHEYADEYRLELVYDSEGVSEPVFRTLLFEIYEILPAHLVLELHIQTMTNQKLYIGLAAAACKSRITVPAAAADLSVLLTQSIYIGADIGRAYSKFTVQGGGENEQI